MNQDNQPVFGIHGGGNIGLGCMAEIVAASPKHYKIVATSSDKFTNSLINVKNRYWLQHSANTETTCVDDVNMIYSRDKNNIIWLYSHADILAICLTERGLINVASDIADGLIKRYHKGEAILDILILMNHTQPDKFVRQIITQALLLKTRDELLTKRILNRTRFIPTVVDRIVSKIDKKKIIRVLRKQLRALPTHQLAQYHEGEKTVTQDTIIEDCLSDAAKLAKIIRRYNLKFNLFKTERDFILCAPCEFKQAKNFPRIKTVCNIQQFAEIKNKYMNGPHSMLAWIGGLMGFKTIAEAINRPSMHSYINHLMEDEIAPILKTAFPDITYFDLKNLKNMFIKRCQNSKADLITRVGRDPLRKLNKGERVRGVLDLKRKHRINLPTPELERGIAAGILYALKSVDPHNDECKKIQEIYSQTGSYKAILCYNGPYGKGKYPGLDMDKDKQLINNVLNCISDFQKIYSLRKTNIRRPNFNRPLPNAVGAIA